VATKLIVSAISISGIASGGERLQAGGGRLQAARSAATNASKHDDEVHR
jgi:hypothetical protein